jgi:hypothetical protein
MVNRCFRKLVNHHRFLKKNSHQIVIRHLEALRLLTEAPHLFQGAVRELHGKQR